MATDVIFTLNRVWISSSAAYEDIMVRVVKELGPHQEALAQLMLTASEIGYLPVVRQPRDVQIELTTRLLKAAQDEIRDRLARGESSDHFPKLESLAIEHLEELHGGQGGKAL